MLVGSIAAAALRCVGGQMQCRLVLDTQAKRERAFKMGIEDPAKKYQIDDMVRGDCLFAATGVTNGSMLRGVQFRGRRFDTGNPVDYLRTIIQFAVERRDVAADFLPWLRKYLDDLP